MAAVDPITNPSTYDTIVVDGLVSPGIARLKSGGDKGMEVDVQQQPGFAGAIAIFRRENLSKLVYTFELWTAQQFQAWRPFVASLHKARKQKPKPKIVSLIDPRIEHNDIKQVYVVNIGAQQDLGGGKAAYDVEFLEYKKPISIGFKPATASVQSEFDKVNKQIEKAQEDANKLLAGAQTAFDKAKAAK